jgi:hypothetical protein
MKKIVDPFFLYQMDKAKKTISCYCSFKGRDQWIGQWKVALDWNLFHIVALLFFNLAAIFE